MESYVILSDDDIKAVKEGKEVKVPMTEGTDVIVLSEYAYSEKFLKEMRSGIREALERKRK